MYLTFFSSLGILCVVLGGTWTLAYMFYDYDYLFSFILFLGVVILGILLLFFYKR